MLVPSFSCTPAAPSSPSAVLHAWQGRQPAAFRWRAPLLPAWATAASAEAPRIIVAVSSLRQRYSAPTPALAPPAAGAQNGVSRWSIVPLAPVPMDAQAAVVRRYLVDLERYAFDDAFALLNPAARAYYRRADNFRSVYVADGYRIGRFALLGVRRSRHAGSVYFVRETAQYHDWAHETELRVTATVPLGVVLVSGTWRIKDPGHPWRALATDASTRVDGLRVSVKKVSFFARRIETIVTFANLGDRYVTLLPYGKSILRDDVGTPYRIIETRDWALTDKQLFEGLRLAPDAQYTGMLAFACERPLGDGPRVFTLTVAPLMDDGADQPHTIEVHGIGARTSASRNGAAR